MKAHLGRSRWVVAAAFVGGTLLGLVGLIFQPPLAFAVAAALLVAAALRTRPTTDGVRKDPAPLWAWGLGMWTTFIVLLLPRLLGSG